MVYINWSPGIVLTIQNLDSLCGLVIWDVVGLEWGPLSLATKIKELLETKVAAPGQENRDYGHGGSAALLCNTPLSTKVGTNFADNR
jgi:hypothetical protein